MTSLITWQEFGPRSLLFLPADKAEDLLPKAIRSGADGVIVDLEDAVGPEVKNEARRIGSASIAAAASPIPVVARVNPVDSPWFEADVSAVVQAGARAIALPKCESGDAVVALGALLGDAPVAIIPMIETARGVLAADAIADADPRVIGVAFGAEDLSAQMGLRRSRSGHELLHARSHVSLAAAAAGRWALDSPCVEPRGVQATKREAATARALGYAGKLVIHPAQVAPVHDAFAPTIAELEAANAVVEAFEAWLTEGSGVGTVRGRMVDRPMVIAAKRLLDRAGPRQ